MFGAAVVLAVLGAAYANLWRFQFPTVASDEPTYAVAGWRYVHGTTGPLQSFTAPANSDNFEHPPLAKYLYGLAEMLAGHVSVPADRVVSGCCVLATAAILGIWIARVANRWTGLAAGLLLAVLPMSVTDVDFRLGRYAMLDPVAELFMVASVVAAWYWFRHSGARSWVWAGATGILVGLSSASKENGFLGAVGPVILGVVLAASSRRHIFIRVGQAAVAVCVSGITFLALYLPLPHPLSALRYLIHFQSYQSHVGHVVRFAGRVTDNPPWWAFLWFAAHGLGSEVTIVSLGCVTAALLLRRDRVVWWCVAALIAPLVFHMFIAGVVLAYYWVMWMPAYLALVALGIGQLAKLASWRPLPLRAIGLMAVVPILAITGVVSVRDAVRLARTPVTGPERLAAVMQAHGLGGHVLVSGLASWQFWQVPVSGLTFALPPSLRGFDTVVTGAPRCRHVVDRTTKALVDLNVKRGTLHEVYADSAMTVYAARGSLLPPTPSDVSAEPVPDPAAGC